MSTSYAEIGVKGKATAVPSVQISGRDVIATGKWLRTANVRDEELVEGETAIDPEAFVEHLKHSGLQADIFTFAQKLGDQKPKFSYLQEWDNWAAIPITTYSDWWDNRAESSVRRAVRKAVKSGVEVRVAQLDDAFVQGIVSINNESPVRQGKAFWHYQKDAESVRREHATYPERTAFLGAYFQGEMIGYLRMTFADRSANIIQILSKMKHFDKRPTNALIAKAVEMCDEWKMSYLTYCNYVYNDADSSLTEFKRRSGFEQILLPRYYIPLTLKGKIALKLGMHHGIVKMLPKPMLKRLLAARKYWYERKLKTISTTDSEQ
jgi:hypothetical protein